jgi:linoleoyl-CoA desaturase
MLMLKKRVKQERLCEPTPLIASSVYLLHVATMLSGIYVCISSDNLLISGMALLISTYGAVGVSTSAHCASHGTATYNRRIDRALTFFGFPLLLGVSEAYWRHKHIRVHHAHPNNIDIDDDIDLKPFFILSEDEQKRYTGWRLRFYNIQHWVFPLALALNTINVQQTSLRYLVKELRQRKRLTISDWADIACLSGHMIAFLLVPSWWWSWQEVAGFYLLREALSGYAAFALFAPAHFPAEAKFVKTEEEQLDLVGRQLYTTVNYRTGFLGRLVCSGVQYQIEHHLLPQANQHKMRRISEIVQEFCRQHGYPYRTLGWWEAIVKSWLAIKMLKPVHSAEQLSAEVHPKISSVGSMSMTAFPGHQLCEKPEGVQ